MESIQKNPLAFSSNESLVPASSRKPLRTSDGTLLNIEMFEENTSEDSPILLLTHGVCESAETFGVQTFVSEAKKRSIKVAVLELEGHGLSSGQELVCGDFDRLVNHFLEFVKHSIPALRGNSDAPYFISGNSLGGAIVIYAAEELSKNKSSYPSNFKGVAPVAPAIGVDARAVPPAPIVQCLKLLSYFAPAAQVPFTPLEDPSNYNCPVDSKRNFTGHWPLSTSKMLLDLTSNRVNKDRLEGNLSLKHVDNVFIITGEQDMVVPTEPISSFHEEIKSSQKDFFVVPNAGHDLLFEEKSSKIVVDALFDWIIRLKHVVEK